MSPRNLVVSARPLELDADDEPAGEIVALRPVGGTSLSQQTLHALVHAIRSGAFDGGRVPPEDNLAKMLAVSRTTVRRALQSLEQLGLIERRPGRGTRVRPHANPDLLALHGLVPFPNLLRELGHEVTTQVRWVRNEVADPDLAVLLGRPVVGVVYRRDIVLLADDEPAISMVERFDDFVLSRPLDDEDLSAGSILFLSERCFTEQIDHAIAGMEPCVSGDHNDGAAAGVAAGDPFFVLNEIFYSSEDTALGASEVSVNPKFVSFSVFRRFCT